MAKRNQKIFGVYLCVFLLFFLGSLNYFLAPDKPSDKPRMDLSNLSMLLKLFLAEAPYHDITFKVDSELIPAYKWWVIKKKQIFFKYVLK